MTNAWRFAIRELRGGLRGFRVYLICLILGVMAISAIGSLRASIEAGLSRDGAALIGGDAVVRMSSRSASENERAWMASIAQRVSSIVDFRSMAVVDREEPERALTQVKAVDDLYPLIGSVTLSPEMSLETALTGDGPLPGAVIERALADRLGLAVGDVFRLGTQDFSFTAILESYPDNAGIGFSLGPRTIVKRSDLANSGLLGEGTLMESEYRLLLHEGANLGRLESTARTRFRDDGLSWRDTRDGVPGASRFVDRLGSFLVLLGLAGLAVGGVGISAAIRSYITRKREVIAILKTLGASRHTIFLTYAFQVAIISAIGILIGVILGAALPAALSGILKTVLPFPSVPGVYPFPMFEAALYGALTAAIFTLWPLSVTERIKPAELFRQSLGDGFGRPRNIFLIILGGLVLLLVAAATLFSGRPMIALSTMVGTSVALLCLAWAARGIGSVARRLMSSARGYPAIRTALAAIAQRREETTTVTLSLGLGLTVLAAIGQIDANMQRAIADDLPSVAPSYFIVDIQPDQIDGVRERFTNDPGVTNFEAAPSLRGIITAINGQPAREVTDHWVVRGDRGVTYSEHPRPGTEITEGEWWPENYDGPPLVSFSDEEAREIGLQLGDTITVNILGREITATITNFRNVSFEDAGIGFVLSMTPSSLAGAPHTWISTVYAKPEAEAAIVRDLAKAYPNITAIRIRDAVDQVMVIVGGVSRATRYAAAFTLLIGFVVLVGATAAGEPARVQESAILKTLGADRRLILKSFTLRSAITGIMAALIALIAGLVAAWAVARFLWETSFVPDWQNAAMILIGGLIISLIAGIIFAIRPLAAKPARVLRARE